MQVDSGQDDEETATHAAPSIEVSVSKNDEMSSVSEAPEASHLNDELASSSANVIEMDTGVQSEMLDSSLEDPLPPVHTAQPVSLESDIGQEGSSTSNVEQKTIDSPPVRVSSPQTSPSVESVSRQPSTKSSDNSESDPFWSESASSFGMDGTALSKAHQLANSVPMANEIGRRWVEMQSRRKTSDAPEPSDQVSQSKSLDELPEEPQLDTSKASLVAPNKSNALALPDLGASVPALSQSLETTEPSQKLSSDVKEDNENASLEQVEKDQKDLTSLTQDTQQEDLQRTVKESGAKSLDGVRLGEGNEVEEPSISPQTKEEGLFMDKDLNDQDSVSQTAIQEPASPDESLPKRSIASQATKFDVRSDVGQNETRAASIDAEDMLEQSLTSVANDQRIGPSRHANDIAEQDKFTQRESLVQESGVLSEEFDDQKKVNAISEIDLTSENNSPIVENYTFGTADPTGNVQEHIHVLDSNNEMIKTKTLQDSITDSGEPPSRLRLPSTVQDTFEIADENQLMTANDAQEIKPFSQESASPIHSSYEIETAPPSNLVLETTDSMDVQVSRTSESIDEEPSPTQASEISVSLVPLEPPDAFDDLVDIPEYVITNDVAEVGSEIDASNYESSQEPVTQSSQADLPPNKSEEVRDSGKGSSLISRLKELRRQSDVTEGERLSSSSASPWFTPRTPSFIASDHAESQGVVSSAKQRKKPATKKAKELSPAKVERRPSDFIVQPSPTRSPQPQSPSVPDDQESQYFPNSQQATGFRTSTSYYVPLTSLHTHYGTFVDLMAVAISSTAVTRATSGPKDNNQTIYITDPPSSVGKNPTSLTTAQIFRPYRTKKESLECFPSIQPGDTILLRDFKVQSFEKSISLISTDSSAWAVFRKDADVQIPGPPVEYGPEERAFARALWDWWSSLEPEQSAALVAAVPKPKTGSTKKTPAKKGLGFDLPSSQSKKAAKKAEKSDNSIPVSLRERSGNSKSSQVLETNDDNDAKGNPATPPRRVLRPRKARGMASASPEKEAEPVVEEIHELRDGTRYVDREDLGVEDVEAANGVHDLRDGTRYRDRLRK